MAQCFGIVICGLNGCGKSTLTRILARQLGYLRMDVEDYYFRDAAIPYTSSRAKEEVRALMLADIRRCPRFVLASVRPDWGKEINDAYALAVVLSASKETRMRRIEDREIDKFGSRVLPGGDMYAQQQRFRATVADRTEDMVEEGLPRLSCPILRLNAENSVQDNIKAIKNAYEKVIAMQENAPLTIQVRYHADIPPLEKLPQGDWIDLRAAETVDMKAGEYRLISLGVSMKLPAGYEAHVAPRSSTFKKWGILMTNSVGVIDESYCGDNDLWYFSAVALRDTHIGQGDRICQFRLMKKMPDLRLETVKILSAPDRGGIGSTGER